MNFSFGFPEIFGLADFIRSALPWQWRPYFSNSLVWAILLVVAAVALVSVHYATREKPKIAWGFQTTGFPVALEWYDDGERLTFFVGGLNLGGENISGHTLNQVDAGIHLLRDNSEIPVFVILDSGWAPLSDISSVPSRAILDLGIQFRSDGVHLERFPKRMTPDEFLGTFGGFTYSVTIDGDKKTWLFTIDDLRKQMDEQMRRAMEARIQNPFNRPKVRRRVAG